jgi:hypothetical protein
MNNLTKSMIRSLGCRIEEGEQNITCHNSNIQIIKMPQKDMGRHKIRSFCGSQTIEISNMITGREETDLIYRAMKHQLYCKKMRDKRRLAMKMKGIPIVEKTREHKESKSGLIGDVTKTGISKMKEGFEKYFRGNGLIKKGREELKAEKEELKERGKTRFLSKALKKTLPLIDTTQAGFTIEGGRIL